MRVLSEAVIGPCSLETSSEWWEPSEASALHTEVAEDTLFFQGHFCFQLDASDPLGPWNSATKPVSDGQQTFTVVLSQSPSHTCETASNQLISAVTTIFYAFRETDTYRFTGKPYSSATGLYYSFQRWYDPETGRFISQDIISGSISHPQTLNRYTYVANSPTNYVDPTGLYVETPFDIASAAYDVTECSRNPDLVNCGIAAIDVALLFIPGIPALAGPIYRGGSFLARHGDDVARVVPKLDGAIVHLDGTAKVFPRLDDAIDTSIFWRNIERGGAWTGNFEKHHLLPKEFADFFKVAGFKINSGQYLIKLEYNVHKVIHGKGGFLEEGWNAKWQDFIELNRGIQDPAILHQRVVNYLSQLKTQFYLP